MEPASVHAALRGEVVPLSLGTEIAFLPQETKQAVLTDFYTVLPEQLGEVANKDRAMGCADGVRK